MAPNSARKTQKLFVCLFVLCVGVLLVVLVRVMKNKIHLKISGDQTLLKSIVQ